jgi:hypothetical protein
MFKLEPIEHIHLKYMAMPLNDVNEDYLRDIWFLLGIIKGYEMKCDKESIE